MPTNLIEVQDRVTQLLFSSKLILDERMFQKMNDYVDLIQQIDQVLPPGSTLRQLPGYQELKRHRKIVSFTRKVLAFLAAGEATATRQG